MEKESKKDKLFELVLGEDEMTDGVSTISFVEYPAIERDFMFFSKEAESYKFADEEKMMVTGPAMIPNQKILRLDENGDEFFVFFTADTIAKSQELFFKRAQHNNSNVEHLFAVDGVSVVESWTIADPKNDKSSAMGFSGLPTGTWMVTYKVDNQELWSGIKDGTVKGFSIEGQFIEELAKMKSDKKIKKMDFITPDQYDEIQRIISEGNMNTDDMYDAINEVITDNDKKDKKDKKNETK